MIELQELYLENFRSWKKLHIEDFNNKGLCLIQASNGSGKSSIRMAIEYLILDKTSDEVSVTDIPTNGTESCKIYGKFLYNNNVIEITKYRNHNKYKNSTIVVFNNDKDKFTANDRRVTQKNIETLFKITPAILFTSTIFTTNSPSFVEAKESERKDILYDILPLEIYAELYLSVKGKIKITESEINKLKTTISNKEDALKDLESTTSTLNAKADNFNTDIKSEIIYIKKQLKALKPEDVLETRTKIINLKNQINPDISSDLLSNVDTTISEFNSLLAELNTEKKYIDRNISNSESSICPVLNEQCDRLEKHTAELAKKYNKELAKINKRIDKISYKKDAATEERENIKSIIDENKAVEYELYKAETFLKDIESKNESIEQNKKSMLEKIDELKARENPYIDLIEDTKIKIGRTKKEIKELSGKIGELVDDLKYYHFYETAFSKSGIPNMKAEGFLDTLEDKTNEYLNAVSKRMFVEIDSQSELKAGVREKISYNVNHPDKEIKNYFSYSGGERQRVKIADIFAFNSLISRFNFLFLDEILEGSLDSAGKSEVIKLLRHKAKEVGSLFVVSHDDSIKGSFDTVINIIKEEGVSKIV